MTTYLMTPDRRLDDAVRRGGGFGLRGRLRGRDDGRRHAVTTQDQVRNALIRAHIEAQARRFA